LLVPEPPLDDPEELLEEPLDEPLEELPDEPPGELLELPPEEPDDGLDEALPVLAEPLLAGVDEAPLPASPLLEPLALPLLAPSFFVSCFELE
jgi:hypothetical protein